ncbi:hypothetical protein DFJ73DRAFT_378481 [Zopfochytrium polystomum]|nr:hypothetical protein DFJ73DRAFT_378481 [Zopfochytrium polystomum]
MARTQPVDRDHEHDESTKVQLDNDDEDPFQREKLLPPPDAVPTDTNPSKARNEDFGASGGSRKCERHEGRSPAASTSRWEFTRFLELCRALAMTLFRTAFAVPDIPPLDSRSPFCTQHRSATIAADAAVPDLEKQEQPARHNPSIVPTTVRLGVSDIIRELEVLEARNVKLHGRRRLRRLMLQFQSDDAEEIYFREMLLTGSVIAMRLGNLQNLVSFITIFALSRSGAWIDRPIMVILLALALANAVVGSFITTWKSGEILVWMYLRSKFCRSLVLGVNILSLVSLVLTDFFVGREPWDVVGTSSLIGTLSICLLSGVVQSFTRNMIYIATLVLVMSSKAATIAVFWKSKLGAVVYASPAVISFLLVSDYVYTQDKTRRKHFLKGKLIEQQLAGLEEEQRKTEYLLSLTLPSSIIDRLLDVDSGNLHLLSNWLDSATVLFMDLTNYRDISATLASKMDSVLLLNMVFHKIEELSRNYPGIERIKTIQSKLLLLGGLRSADHLKEMIEFALAVRSILSGRITLDLPGKTRIRSVSVRLEFAFGIHAGPLVTGIVGKRTFCFEVYGDTVNTASRMLSMAAANQIVVSEQVWESVSELYEGESLGERFVKGKGVIPLYTIDKRMAAPGAPGTGPRDVFQSRQSLPVAPISKQQPDSSTDVFDDEFATEFPQAGPLTITSFPLPKIDASILQSMVNNSYGASVLTRRHSALQSTLYSRPAEIETSNGQDEKASIRESEVHERSSPSLKQIGRNPSLPHHNDRYASTTTFNGSLIMINQADGFIAGAQFTPFKNQLLKRTSTIDRKRQLNESRNTSVHQLVFASEATLPTEHATAPPTDSSHKKGEAETGRRRSSILASLHIRSPRSNASGTFSPRSRRVFPSHTHRSAAGSKAGSTSSLRAPPPSRRRSSWFGSLFETKAESTYGMESRTTMPSVLIEEVSTDSNLSVVAEDQPKIDRMPHRISTVRYSDAEKAQRSTLVNIFRKQGGVEGSNYTQIAGSHSEVPYRIKSQRDIEDQSGARSVKKLETNDEHSMAASEPNPMMLTADNSQLTPDEATQPQVSDLKDANLLFSMEELASRAYRLHEAHDVEAFMSGGVFPSPHGGTSVEMQKESHFMEAVADARKSFLSLFHIPAGPMARKGNEAIARKDSSAANSASPLTSFGIAAALLQTDLQFSDREKEKNFQLDSSATRWTHFQRLALKGVLVQVYLVFLAILNVYIVRGFVGPRNNPIISSPPTVNDSDAGFATSSGSVLESSSLWFAVLGVVIVFIGSQLLITVVCNQLRAPSPAHEQWIARCSIFSVFAVEAFTVYNWNGLRQYFLFQSLSMMHCILVFILLMYSLSLKERILICIVVGFAISVYDASFTRNYALMFFGPLFSVSVWGTVFALLSALERMAYHIDTTLTRQSEMVKEAIAKSSGLLNTVMPQRFIMQLLVDPNVVFFEEFEMITVLHMDIAGFTAMSSSLEPIDVFLIVNNLFSYFDRLTEDFDVEKITTIGDAYVACSSLTRTEDPALSATAVCIVALMMQSFVKDQLNESELMKSKLRQSCTMRIGIHSGPCHGSIVGGSTNFRYDLMGEAASVSEKVQEQCIPGNVFITGATVELVKNYRGFEIRQTEMCSARQELFHLVGNSYFHGGTV